jgi:hypothetical protein
MIQWGFGALGYQSYSSVSQFIPPNMSFSQAIYALSYSLDTNPYLSLTSLVNLIEANQGIWGVVVFSGVILMILFFKRFLTLVQISILIVSCISMFSATTYYYYGVFAVPAILALMADKRQVKAYGISNLKKQLKNSEERVSLYLWFASIATLIQLPLIGWNIGSQVVTTSSFVGSIWITV